MVDYRKAHHNIHHWLRYNYGPATHCEVKGCDAKSSYLNSQFTYALKKGKKHAKNIKNYKQLCKAHHKQYDTGRARPEISSKYVAMIKLRGIRRKDGKKVASTSLRVHIRAREKLRKMSIAQGMSIAEIVEQLLKKKRI